LMPAVVPSELWRRAADGTPTARSCSASRTGGPGVLPRPHPREVVTDLVRREVRSTGSCVTLYRSRASPRRDPPPVRADAGREFHMKDAYSFDADEEGARGRIRRCTRRIAGSSGGWDSISGRSRRIPEHRRLELARVHGDRRLREDAVVFLRVLFLRGDVEKAECLPPETPATPMGSEGAKGATPQGPHPGKRTIGGVGPSSRSIPRRSSRRSCSKPPSGRGRPRLRGHEVNEIKVKNHLGADYVRLAGEERVREMTGAPSGFAGPVGSPFDDRGPLGPSIASGPPARTKRMSTSSMSFPGGISSRKGTRTCGWCARGPVPPVRRSAAVFARDRGRARLPARYEIQRGDAGDLPRRRREGAGDRDGCYGIGVGRTAAAAIEQNHDGDGSSGRSPSPRSSRGHPGEHEAGRRDVGGRSAWRRISTRGG